MVVELRLQYCGKFFRIHLRHIKTILRRIFTEFNRKTDFQNHLFGWVRFENRFYNCQITTKQKSYNKLISCLGTG